MAPVDSRDPLIQTWCFRATTQLKNRDCSASGFHRFLKEINEPQQVLTSNSGICYLRLCQSMSRPLEVTCSVCESCFFVISFWLFCGRCDYSFFLVIGIRHLRGFWFSRELRGDQGEAGALAEGRPGVDGLGTVGRQHPSVLPNAPCDGQTGLVPHGFCKC